MYIVINWQKVYTSSRRWILCNAVFDYFFKLERYRVKLIGSSHNICGVTLKPQWL